MNNFRRRVTIFGLPRDWSFYRLHNEIDKYTKAWNVVDIVPLEECLMVNINCKSEESYECFMNLADIMPYTYPNLRVYSGTVKWHLPQPRNQNHNLKEVENIFDLNLDCLIYIFERCTLGEQIVLAKTCYYFYKVVMSIWKRKFSVLYFSLHALFEYHNIKEEEMWDFCMLVGRFLKFLICDTLCSLKTFATFFEDENWQPWDDALECSVNFRICRHLVHFPYLEIFQIEGNYLTDHMLLELSRCCPNIRELQFLDAYTFWTTGKYFNLFRNLEVIDICSSMRFRLGEMLKVCNELRLKKLNIVDTRKLYEPAFFAALVKTQYATLTTLWLSAIKDKDTILLILKLPLLENLKFYWAHKFKGFEEILFSALLEKCQNSLHTMSFELQGCPYSMMMCRYGCRNTEAWSSLVASVDKWKMPEFGHKKFLDLLNACTSLAKLSFRHCRLFGKEDTLSFPELCESLRLIQLIGCFHEFDEKLFRSWRRGEDSSCELSTDGVREYPPFQVGRIDYFQYGYRSIECNFKNLLSEKKNSNQRQNI